jgi:hypothetical protein
LNPHGLPHVILSHARLPFRHFPQWQVDYNAWGQFAQGRMPEHLELASPAVLDTNLHSLFRTLQTWPLLLQPQMPRVTVTSGPLAQISSSNPNSSRRTWPRSSVWLPPPGHPYRRGASLILNLSASPRIGLHFRLPRKSGCLQRWLKVSLQGLRPMVGLRRRPARSAQRGRFQSGGIRVHGSV